MKAPRSLVDYALLGRAAEAYAALGYRQIEVPWRVGYRVALATLSEDALNSAVLTRCQPGGDVLVGSAEQGFLALALAGEISPADGPLFAVSPCFRDGDAGRSELHHADFVKLELWRQLGDGDATGWTEIVAMEAAVTMAKLGAVGIDSRVVGDGFDLELGGVEVGSYGYREARVGGQTIRWIYGTGLALPRFSQALAVQTRTGRKP